MSVATLVQKSKDKIHGLRKLARWMRTVANWRELWRYRRDRNMLPPIRLRSGEVLNHGPLDSPLLLLDEVWVKEWYSLDAHAPTNGTMLDIGANIGSVTLYWARREPSLQIHCYEPNPAAFATLQRNVRENGLSERTEIYEEGVAREDGTLHLWVDVPTDLATAYGDVPPVPGGRRISVPVVCIDEIWRRARRQKIWLLKIDTEGAEADILEGASSAFLSAVENAMVEFHDNIVPGVFDRCRSVLDKAGFHYRVLHHAGSEGIIYASRRAADQN